MGICGNLFRIHERVSDSFTTFVRQGLIITPCNATLVLERCTLVLIRFMEYYTEKKTKKTNTSSLATTRTSSMLIEYETIYSLAKKHEIIDYFIELEPKEVSEEEWNNFLPPCSVARLIYTIPIIQEGILTVHDEDDDIQVDKIIVWQNKFTKNGVELNIYRPK